MSPLSAANAISKVVPAAWASTTAAKRLELLKSIRSNLSKYADALAESDAAARNSRLSHGNEMMMFSKDVSRLTTTLPLGNAVAALIELYEPLTKGKMLKPRSVKPSGDDDLWDIHVFPRTAKQKLLYIGRNDYIRVKSEGGPPKQTSPMDKPPGIVGVLGAGNTSSSAEVIKALFLDNCVVVHKAHPLNKETDKIWEKVLQPLVDCKALAFCDVEQGPQLAEDDRLTKLYFTGSADLANSLAKTTRAKKEFVSECGGNCPVLLVPGIRPWTASEIKHQAIQLATIAKGNGGAACARPQTIVLSKNWEQREDFIKALEMALEEETPAVGTYYPGTKKGNFAKFQEAYPEAKLLHPEAGKYGEETDVLFIRNDKAGSYSCKNEAFCQVLVEIPLDIPGTPNDFLPAAVDFCNKELLGSLVATVLVDDDTLKAHKSVVDKAVDDLNYGVISVNSNALIMYFYPHMIWGGNEADRDLIESGKGNFGNLFNYNNVVKSISYDAFVSPAHFKAFNKHVFNKTAAGVSGLALNPSWYNHLSLLAFVLYGSFKSRDF